MPLIKKIWQDGAPRQELRVLLSEYLQKNVASTYELWEIAKIGDDELSSFIEAMEDLPTVVHRVILKQRRSRPPVPQEIIPIASEKLYRVILSAEIDECDAGQTILRFGGDVGWPKNAIVLREDGEDFLEGKLTVLHREAFGSDERVLAGRREDLTTVELLWLIRSSDGMVN